MSIQSLGKGHLETPRNIRQSPAGAERPLSFSDSIWRRELDLQPELTNDEVLRRAFEGPSQDMPYHVFTADQKKRLIVLVSFAAIFSPLSSNIYFPALPVVAKSFHVDPTLATLSITSYLIFQGLAPSIWGPLSDSLGRRPIFLSTMVVYVLANVGLGLSRSFTALMVFRAIQAAGSSATIALGSGVIGDTTIRSERGGLMGIFGGLRMFGQAFGPVLGGVLSEYLGFRSIFWFLTVAAVIVTVALYLFLPETHRSYAGSGSLPQRGIYQTGWALIRRRSSRANSHESPAKKRISSREPMALRSAFKKQCALLKEKDIIVTLLFGGAVYTVWSMVTASTSTLFKEEYHLSQVHIGLVFVPNGLGCIFGSYMTGIAMDRVYKSSERRFKKRIKDASDREDERSTFPLERTRLLPLWYIVPIFIGTVAGYGWTLESNMAGPLVLQFVIAFTATAVFNVNSTMVIDLWPSAPASATAVNNLIRCLLGAVGVGVVEELQARYKERVLYSSLAALTLVSCVLLLVEWTCGQRWRVARDRRSNILQ